MVGNVQSRHQRTTAPHRNRPKPVERLPVRFLSAECAQSISGFSFVGSMGSHQKGEPNTRWLCAPRFAEIVEERELPLLLRRIDSMVNGRIQVAWLPSHKPYDPEEQGTRCRGHRASRTLPWRRYRRTSQVMTRTPFLRYERDAAPIRTLSEGKVPMGA